MTFEENFIKFFLHLFCLLTFIFFQHYYHYYHYYYYFNPTFIISRFILNLIY